MSARLMVLVCALFLLTGLALLVPACLLQRPPRDSPAALRQMRESVDAILRRVKERNAGKPESDWPDPEREILRVGLENDAWLKARGH